MATKTAVYNLDTGHVQFLGEYKAQWDPGPTYRGPIEVIVAPTRQWFEHWCHMDCNPPVNPNDRRFVLITGARDVQRLRGRRAQPEDVVRWIADDEQLIEHGRWRTSDFETVWQEIHMLGFAEGQMFF